MNWGASKILKLGKHPQRVWYNWLRMLKHQKCLKLSRWFQPRLNRAYCSMQILLLKPHNYPVGLVQLSTLPSFLQTRKLRFRKVRRLLKCTKLVRGQAESWIYTIWLQRAYPSSAHCCITTSSTECEEPSKMALSMQEILQNWQLICSLLFIFPSLHSPLFTLHNLKYCLQFIRSERWIRFRKIVRKDLGKTVLFPSPPLPKTRPWAYTCFLFKTF